ncbi:hypothetical protein COCNU_13G004000 [Cocos nucifera]|uniref:Trafficking protein particle complex subunit 5 n=1 Tax=Cocos nucifera TaxID=13894 RepID=A0A8K0ITE8_COCNU|nr:hypothetical protein COCNU_13G004000 [Cocos nucifera]
MIGAGKIKQYANVLDKPLSRGRQEVSLSAFAFLFSELVQYNQTRVDNIAELERRLEDAGYAVGARVLELLCHREKVADSLEKGTEHEDEYMISEKELLVNRFISIPKDMGTFNCGAFVAGIVKVIILEIRNRAMKAKSRPKDLFFSGSFSWSVSPTTGRVIVASKEKRGGEEECEAADGEESEAFFSVKSCFSRCSSDGGSQLKEFRRRSIFEEFKHCEGWPFGLSRRASMLPPLPSSPKDSWMWHKKNLVSKTCTLN